MNERAVNLLLLWMAAIFLLSACSKDSDNQVTFTGTVMTGEQLGEAKNFCAEGYYLVAEEGTLVDQTQMLLLRVSDGADGTQMFSDRGYIGRTVEVSGTYPAQEFFCEALTCECEDYIKVDEIRVVP